MPDGINFYLLLCAFFQEPRFIFFLSAVSFPLASANFLSQISIKKITSFLHLNRDLNSRVSLYFVPSSVSNQKLVAFQLAYLKFELGLFVYFLCFLSRILSLVANIFKRTLDNHKVLSFMADTWDGYECNFFLFLWLLRWVFDKTKRLFSKTLNFSCLNYGYNLI